MTENAPIAGHETQPDRAAPLVRWWRKPTTRSEAFLFGLLVLALMLLLGGARERTVFVVPAPMQAGIVVT
jgi:hypothetical protein